ncbi:MAG TPA: glycosyltransferase [Bacteroidales bacterium]|nr:glycosyltransferase [Bacteroidales bacterium]
MTEIFHLELKKRGYNSKVLLLHTHKATNDINAVYVGCFSKLYLRGINFFKRKIYTFFAKFSIVKNIKADAKYCFLYLNQYKTLVRTKQIVRKISIKPDAIILYFLQDFIHPKNIYELYIIYKVPILWVFPDMNPMTGGCHYNWGCEGYKYECGKCPALKSNDPNDITHKNFIFKQRYFKSVKFITFFGGDEINYSSIFKNITNKKLQAPINPDIFKPNNKIEVRAKMGLPTDKKIIFFGAQYINEERKGIKLLIHALNLIKKYKPQNIEDVFLVLAGRCDDTLLESLPFPYKFLGLLDANRELPAAFQAANVFVSPSIQDAGPIMVNMSIMCGTPVVSFNIGVAKDLVVDGETGYRVELGELNKFAEGVQRILDLNSSEYIKMSNNCRELGLKLSTTERQVDVILEAIKNNN